MKNPFARIFKRGMSDPWHWLTRITSNTSAAGMNVTPDNAIKVSAVYACVKVISETIASLPLMLYERVGDNKQPASSHPLYSILHDAPNDFMTSFEFRELIAAHLNLRGNFYAQKIEKGRVIKALLPMNPANMEVFREDGALKYRYTHEDGTQEVFSQDRIWHVRNFPITCSYNGQMPEGVLGVSPVTVARESIGLALAGDEYGGRYFSNNAQIGLNLRFPGKLSENAKAFLKESLAEYSRMENKFKSIVTEEGGTIEALGMSNQDSQFIESRQFQIEEIARIFRVPPVLIGHPTNTMTYASAEQMFLSFGKFTIHPWCRRIEQSINSYLIPEKDRERYFAEFKIEGLLRADTQTRMAFYASARQWGIMCVDEIRALENMDPLPDGKGAIYLQPLNMVEAGTEYEPKEKAKPKEKEEGDGAS